MQRILLALALLPLALAGCAGDSGEGAKLSFDGEDSGTHSEDANGCDDDATLTGSGNIEDGSVMVTVTDGGGDEVFSEEYSGDIEVEAERLTGASGDWTLTAVRAGDDVIGDSFTGEYVFNLSC